MLNFACCADLESIAATAERVRMWSVRLIIAVALGIVVYYAVTGRIVAALVALFGGVLVLALVGHLYLRLEHFGRERAYRRAQAWADAKVKLIALGVFLALLALGVSGAQHIAKVFEVILGVLLRH